MTLSEAQVERFSRQIIVPEIGGIGQERLLQSSVAVAGTGALARLAARYLVGAGIGRLHLCGAPRDWEAACVELRDLHPGVHLETTPDPDAVATADVIVACDLAIRAVDAVCRVAAAGGRPLAAGGVRGGRGWLCAATADRPGGPCAACAARRAAELPAGSGALSAPAVGVIGSLLAVVVLRQRLGLPEYASGYLQFDAGTSTLTEWTVSAHRDCPRFRAAGAAVDD